MKNDVGGGSVLYMLEWKREHDPPDLIKLIFFQPPQITEGLIVIAYEDGKTGHTFMLKSEDINKYFDKFTRRLKSFYELERDWRIKSN